MIQQADIDDQHAGRGREIFRMNFGNIVINKAMLFRMESSDLRFGTSFRPVARDFHNYWITLK